MPASAIGHAVDAEIDALHGGPNTRFGARGDGDYSDPAQVVQRHRTAFALLGFEVRNLAKAQLLLEVEVIPLEVPVEDRRGDGPQPPQGMLSTPFPLENGFELGSELTSGSPPASRSVAR